MAPLGRGGAACGSVAGAGVGGSGAAVAPGHTTVGCRCVGDSHSPHPSSEYEIRIRWAVPWGLRAGAYGQASESPTRWKDGARPWGSVWLAQLGDGVADPDLGHIQVGGIAEQSDQILGDASRAGQWMIGPPGPGRRLGPGGRHFGSAFGDATTSKTRDPRRWVGP